MTTRTDSVTVELILAADPSTQDHLIAELTLLGFEAFLQEDQELRAYTTPRTWTPNLQEQIRLLMSKFDMPSDLNVRMIAPENWNARWESSVEPIEVGRFLVTPSWKKNNAYNNGLIRLQVDPKMSFGTGYHATTRLMLRLMPSMVREGDRVLDAGTGTGILAIAAAKLGASFVLGVDNDPWSERNAKENCVLNSVSSLVEIRLDDIDDLAESLFDVILANIQLDVITNVLQSLAAKLAPGGRILFSGILVEQSVALTTSAGQAGLTIIESKTEDEWWATALRAS